MFDFMDMKKNPFMVFMNGFSDEDITSGTFMNPMKFMQGAFMMQMQFTQAMFMLPMYMMQNFLDMMSGGGQTEPAETGNPHENAGFKVGNMPIPPEMLQQLMSMDMSPEDLEKLQKGLDILFSMIPETKKDGEDEDE